MHLKSITSGHPELNISYPLVTEEYKSCTKNWILQRVDALTQFSSCWSLLTDEDHEYSLRRSTSNLSQFDTHVKQVHALLTAPSVLQKLDPRDYCLFILQYIKVKITHRIEKLSLLQPEQTIIDQKWREIQFTFIDLRYRPQPGEIEKIQTFVLLLDQELQKFNHRQTDILSEIFEVLKINSDFADLPLIMFLQEDEKNLPLVSVKNMETLFFEYLDEAQSSCQWACQEVEKQIQPLVGLQNHLYVNPAKDIMSKINEARKKSFPKFTQLSRQKLKALMERKGDLQSLRHITAGGPLGCPGTGSVYYRIIINEVLKEERSEDELVDLGAFYTNQFIQLKQKYPFVDSNVGELGIWKYGELKQLSRFYHTLTLCHRLVDTYIGMMMQQMAQFFYSMEHWYQTHRSSRSMRLLISEIPFSRSAFNETQQLSIDELDAFISSSSSKKAPTTSQKPKKGSKAKVYNESKKVISAVKATAPHTTKGTFAPSNSTSTTSSSEPVSSLMVDINTLADGLHQQIKINEIPHKTHLRQAEMFLQDLALLHAQSDKSLYRLFSTVSALFHFLEQVLKAAVPSTDDRFQHNLSQLAEGLILSDDERQLIDHLYLASYWIRFPYEQLAKWNKVQLSPPPLLLALQQAIEKQKLAPIEIKLQQAIPMAIKLALKLLVKGHSSTFEAPKVLLTLSQSPLPDITVISQVKTILLKFQFPEHHFVSTKLHQAVIAFEQFEVASALLRQKSIDSKAFSLHFRNSVLSFNYGVEALLRACYSFHTGFDTEEHDLIQLAHLLDTHLEKSLLSNSLLTTFHEINRLGRYPFTSLTSLHSELHILLLKAELLREHPECHEGFVLPENSTRLNYIETPKGNQSANDILNRWSTIVGETLPWLNKTLLPLFV